MVLILVPIKPEGVFRQCRVRVKESFASGGELDLGFVNVEGAGEGHWKNE